jgi:hypothetical protein
MQGKQGKCDQCGQVFEIQPTLARFEQLKPEPENSIAAPSELRAAAKPISKTSSNPISTEAKTQPKTVQPERAKPKTASYTQPAQPTTPTSVSDASTTGFPDSVWESLPDAGWYQGASQSIPSIYAQSNVQGNEKGLFGRCFRLAQKNLLMSTLMMLLTNVVSSITMILLSVIPCGIIIFLREIIAIEKLTDYAVILLATVASIPAMLGFFYFLPAYWNIAHLSVRGKEVSFQSVTERSDLALPIFGCSILSCIVSITIHTLIALVLSAVFFAVSAEKSPALLVLLILMSYSAIPLVFFLVASPCMLIPFAMLDGHSFSQAVPKSLSLVYRNAGTFYLLMLSALFIGTVVFLFSCGVLGILSMSFLLMNHAAFYKLTSRRA